MKGKLCLFILAVLCVIDAQQGWGMPISVFVYNQRPDQFDNNAEGFIWQSLGLLNENGSPGTIQGDEIKDERGNVLGHVIRGANRSIIGYRSADRTREAYNVSNPMITTDEAWQRVANGGTFRIIKHGGRYVRGMILSGGGMMLDNGLMYDGFTNRANRDPGTRGGSTHPLNPQQRNGAYPLTPRPGANITFIADGCFTALDPDGPLGPMTSVIASATNVPGVAAVQGHVPIVYGNIQVQLNGGTPQQRVLAMAVLEQAAIANGFGVRTFVPGPGGRPVPVIRGDVVRWLASFPFARQHATVTEIITRHGLQGVTPKITYNLSEQFNSGIAGEISSRYGIATQVDPLPLGSGIYRYTYDEPTQGANAYVDIEPGDLFEPTYFQLNQLGELPAAPPPSTQLVSGIFDFRYLGIEPSVSTLDYGLTIFGDPATTSPYFFDGTDWMLLTNFRFDDQTQTLITSTNRVGILAAFQVVPEPSPLALVIIGILCLSLHAWRRRKQAAEMTAHARATCH